MIDHVANLRRIAAFKVYRNGDIIAAAEEMERLTAKLNAIQSVVNEQAENEGLWSIAKYATEAYLQSELRRLHEVIEGKTGSNAEQGKNNPYGPDRSNCSECSATVYDNEDGLHFGECSQSRAPCIVERCGRLQMSDSEYCDKHYAENITEQGEKE